MPDRLSLRLAGAILATPLLAGCGVTAYTPRPSPRVQVVPDGNSLVLFRDGRKYAVNAFGGEVEEAVYGNPQAEAEAQSFKSKLVAGFILSTIGGVAAGVGTGILVGDAVQPNPSTGVEVASTSVAVTGLALSIVGSIVGGSAQPHLWNAINLYNDGLVPFPARPQPPAYPGYPAAPGYAPPAYAPPPVAPAPPSYAPAPALPPAAAPSPPPAAVPQPR